MMRSAAKLLHELFLQGEHLPALSLAVVHSRQVEDPVDEEPLHLLVLDTPNAAAFRRSAGSEIAMSPADGARSASPPGERQHVRGPVLAPVARVQRP